MDTELSYAQKPREHWINHTWRLRRSSPVARSSPASANRSLRAASRVAHGSSRPCHSRPVATQIARVRASSRTGKGRLPVSYTHLRAHETDSYLVCRLLLE